MAPCKNGHHLGRNEDEGAAIPVHDDDPKRQRAAEQRGTATRRQRLQDARRTTRDDVRSVAMLRGKF